MFSAKNLRQPTRAKTANKLRSAGFVVFCLRGSEAKSEKKVFVKIVARIWLFHKFWGRQDVVLHGRSELFSLPVFARIRILPFSFCLWTRITHFAIKYQRRSRTTKVRKCLEIVLEMLVFTAFAFFLLYSFGYTDQIIIVKIEEWWDDFLLMASKVIACFKKF